MKKLTLLSGMAKSERIALGTEVLIKAFEAMDYEIVTAKLPEDYRDYRKLEGDKVYVGALETDDFLKWLVLEELLVFHQKKPEGEGFYLQSLPGRLSVICGGNEVGALYGCLTFTEQAEQEGALMRELSFYDAPAFRLRGPCLGLQKTKLEPPRHTYEYPITPDRFPWFYDKGMWREFLDMMLKERCNILYLWSGHPFSSLVRLKEYPEALEVTEEEFLKNHELFGWLTKECDRRGIWVVLKFYNIHISLPFARKHGLDLNQSNIHPLVADYTYKSIVEFIKSYPHIGLMVCLGEALRGTQNKTDWFAKTIIPAVKEGVSAAGITEEPPVILRGHDCDPVAAMEAALPQYSNLYTMWKYNGESLTTYLPRGKWQKLHQDLSALSSNHIMNVHILANLEPFRFEAPGYIQKCVQAGSGRLQANGLHLYPLFYWDWPYAPDRSEERILQLHRDWLWFGAWFRYAWNPLRDEMLEKQYWAQRIADHYSCSEEAAKHLLAATEAIAQCAPKLLGRVGITEGNRQTMSLGMTMSQLTNVIKYRPNYELWKSVARRGEQPEDYWKKEMAGEPHLGETPYDLIEELSWLIEKAQSEVQIVRVLLGEECQIAGEVLECGLLTQNSADPIHRIFTDLQAIILMTKHYCAKIKAAMNILHYKYTMDENCRGEIALLEEAEAGWEEAMDYYRQLAKLTEQTYLYANSMQTPQRKIPFPDGEAFGHWMQCLPKYEKEFACFKNHITRLKAGWLPGQEEESIVREKLPEADFTLEGIHCETYTLQKGELLFTDHGSRIQSIAPEIEGMKGIRFGMGEAIVSGITVKLTLTEDAHILIGYFNDKGVEWLQVPELETNTHADDRGGLAVIYANALKAEGCNSVNLHALSYEKGSHELYLGTGAYLIAGVVPQAAVLIPRNAGMEGEGLETLDWLYEEEKN